MFKPNIPLNNNHLRPETGNNNLPDILDIIEFLAVIFCIPLSYLVSRQIILHSELMLTLQSYFKVFFLTHFDYYNVSWQFNLSEFTIFIFIILISWFVLSQVTSMAVLPRNQRYLSVIINFARGNFIVLTVLLVLKFALNLQSIPVIFILTYVVLSMVVTLSIRLVAIHMIRVYRAKGHNLRHVLVIADGRSEGIIEKLLSQKDWGFKINSIITGSKKIKGKYGDDIEIYPATQNIKKMLDENVIDEVLYCKSNLDDNEINEIGKLCNEVGVIFRLQSSISPVDPVKLQLKTLNNQKNLTLVDIPSHEVTYILKTMGDIYISLIAAILLLPFFLIISLAIKLDSPGPVFFKQERIGLRGRKFRLFKFRTMVSNAEEMLEKLKQKNEMDGPAFKIKDDPRITRFGKFLRKTGIDEFPQLINVIMGEMSLIGPRPPLETEVKQYKRWQLRRLSVKPGITCTWQIVPNRNEVTFEQWILMDLSYIDNWTISKDVKLFFKTIGTFFMAAGR